MKSGNRVISTLVCVAAVSGLATACQTPMQRHWGEAVRENARLMIADPEAGRTASGPIEGLDPVSAELVSESYKRSQRQDESDPDRIFLISQ